MSSDQEKTSSSFRVVASQETAALIVASGLILGYAACLLMAFTSHIWLLDSHGHPVPFDFLVFWSAGRLALAGHASAVFDLHLLRAAEISTVGHTFKNILPWPYPPIFLFVAMSLANFPYVTSFVTWVGATVIAQACVVSAIARRSAVFVIALAPPWTLFGVLNGQNGFLTASIIGAVLLSLEQRPALSGVLLGFLCYKPQLAMLFPIALAAAGYWRAFLWAAVGVLVWTALSCAIFGPDILGAFLRGLSAQNHIVLAGNGVAPFNLQSIYGLARWFGTTAAVAGSLQLCLSLACVLSVVVIWRSHAQFNLKAAALAAAIPLATPYLFVSDLAILSIAIAFLFRERDLSTAGCQRVGVAFAMVIVFAFLFRTFPAGLFASLSLSAIVWRRYFMAFSVLVPLPHDTPVAT